MSLAFDTCHSPQQHHPLSAQLSPGMAGGGGGGGVALSQDWLKAWKSWAATRKRGKMAQFIVQKLEDNKQARWLNIRTGKFELTEWHSIAEEWFKEKPRSSDQVDAPCMLRKGLPRAFPGLDEVKTESVKEGTQYRSRVFQATATLVQEVLLYINKPVMSGSVGYTTNGSYFNSHSLQQKDGSGGYPSHLPSSGFVPLNQTSSILGSQPPPTSSTHYQGTPSLYATSHAATSPYQHQHPMNTSPLKVKLPTGGNKMMGQGFVVANYGELSPGGSGDGSGCVKVEETSPYSVQNNSPFSTRGVMDAGLSPARSESTYSNFSETTGGLYNGRHNSSPGIMASDTPPAFDGYDHMADSSPYSVNGGGGGVISPGGSVFTHGSRLEVPQSADGVLPVGTEWTVEMGGMPPSSPHHYSPETSTTYLSNNSNHLDLELSTSMASSVLVPPEIPPPPPMQQQQDVIFPTKKFTADRTFLEVKPYPDKSPLEGGGHLALIFCGELPRGPKWLSFISQQRPEYVHQVQAFQENLMALSIIIPKHDIPEMMTLQVICQGQVVAQTNFTYYANSQYNSDMLFHYLVHNFPGYFPEVGMDGGGMGGLGGGGGAGGEGYSGDGYYNNIPSTSYNLLLGSCRLGIEELVFATLQLPSLRGISTEQLHKAQRLCEEHSHPRLAEVMQTLVELSEITSRGEEEESDGGGGILRTEQGCKILSRLNSADTPEAGGMAIISRLVQIHKMDKRSKLEAEREQQVPCSPTVLPASPVPEDVGEVASPLFGEGGGDGGDSEDGGTSRQRRRSSANRLQRQEKSVREDEQDLGTPKPQHGRKSIAEKDDELPPLRTVLPASRRAKRLLPTHSDAADSAVSMSFDREHGDYEQEMARRTSASNALSGRYSLNMTSMDGSAVTINIDPEAGYTFANSLQYECIYQVTDDYPPHSDATNIIFKAGDKIIQIGDTSVNDKGPDDFAGLLQEAVGGTSIRIVPRVSPPPTISSINSSLGYWSLESASGRGVCQKPSEQQVIDAITMKVSNLLSMKGSGFKRTLTLPYVAGEKGFGFKVIGGNAVGLFVSEAKRKELQVGDQILEIAGHSALQMSHYEASELVADAKETLQLKVTQNVAKFKSIRDQFEYESFYIRCHVDHIPSDPKDMALSKGSLVRVVNSSLYSDSWLAWSVDESTGIDMELRRIPSPSKAYHQFGKHVYQSVEGLVQDMVS